MKALILVGGYGTRLRPLTLSVPKPLIEFCNKSLLERQVEALVGAGVDHVVLAVAYQPHAMRQALTELEAKYKIRIESSVETEALGTGGPLKLAEPLLRAGSSGDENTPFFVFNSDIISSFPLREMLAFHTARGGACEGTVLTTRVEDPTRFGVVVRDAETGKINQFIEKPRDATYGNLINAGLYIMNLSVLARIQVRPTSLEKEVFPEMAAAGKLLAFELQDGFWADIGQPEDFLRGQRLFLEAAGRGGSHHCSSGEDRSNERQSSERQSGDRHSSDGPSDGSSDGPSEREAFGRGPVQGVLQECSTDCTTKQSQDGSGSGECCGGAASFVGAVSVSASAQIGAGSRIGPNVSIGAGCVVGAGVRLRDAAVMAGARVGAHSWVTGSIVGAGCRLGRWVRVEGLSVLAEDVAVADECFVNRAAILPHKSITESIHEPGKIIM